MSASRGVGCRSICVRSARASRSYCVRKASVLDMIPLRGHDGIPLASCRPCPARCVLAPIAETDCSAMPSARTSNRGGCRRTCCNRIMMPRCRVLAATFAEGARCAREPPRAPLPASASIHTTNSGVVNNLFPHRSARYRCNRSNYQAETVLPCRARLGALAASGKAHPSTRSRAPTWRWARHLTCEGRAASTVHEPMCLLNFPP